MIQNMIDDVLIEVKVIKNQEGKSSRITNFLLLIFSLILNFL